MEEDHECGKSLAKKETRKFDDESGMCQQGIGLSHKGADTHVVCFQLELGCSYRTQIPALN